MVEFLTDFSTSPFSLALATSPWVVPTMQSIHLFSIAIIFTSVLIIALRVLGMVGTDQPLQVTVTRFAPWAWGAFAALAATGLVLIVTEPIRQLLAVSFWLKMALILVALFISIRFLRRVKSDEAFANGSAAVAERTRIAGVLTIALWVAIIFLGRFIAYDPQMWGEMSPLFAL